MIRRSSHGTVWYQFSALARYHEVRHAIFTRLGGASTGHLRGLNVGHLVGDHPATVAANQDRIFTTLGVTSGQVVSAQQVHGADVALVGPSDGGSVVPATDGLVTRDHGVVLMLRFADCVPLMLYDPLLHAVALVHVGWRGLAAGIMDSALSLLHDTLHSDVTNLLASLGPSIHVCCYEVAPDLQRRVEHALGPCNALFLEPRPGRLHFDLPQAVRRQLEQHGVTQIEESGICTACRTDEFFSHRAEHGSTGRFAALLSLS